MTDPETWKRIKEVAERRRDASARGLARSTTRAQEARQKLQLLLDYRLDYRTRFDAASQAGMRGEWLRNYQVFLGNLEQAIALQTEAVRARDNEVAEAQIRVDADQRRAESYRILDERKSAASLVDERRREQRMQDEMATRPVPGFVAHSES